MHKFDRFFRVGVQADEVILHGVALHTRAEVEADNEYLDSKTTE